ncbi:MAG: glycosyltransferase family 2 protein [Anaerolineae bacterium]|nr:glycosyltransferase family 2 protein [Anaerolineae bacterium]MCO5204909.1 glycosyltransferase family 2 protein [Anaerolineae bacterium]
MPEQAQLATDNQRDATHTADLAIVIVNYNVAALLRRCLETVFAAVGDLDVVVCVVDNNSADDSVAMVRRHFPQVALLANDNNPGYAAANNQGWEYVVQHAAQPPRYCLLLNPDTELEPDTLAKSIAFMDAHPDIGIMGPKLLLPTGELDVACRRSFPTPTVSLYRFTGLSKLFPQSRRFGRYNLTYLDIDQRAEVDSVVGAFMLIRAAALQEIGLLDTRYWMYGEDLDLAKRVKDIGWRVVYNPDVVAWHVKRASSKQNSRAHPEFYRAMLIFYYKHYRQETRFPLHQIILLGIAAKGGRAVWPDVVAGAALLQRDHVPA